MAGTDPTNAASVLAIAALSRGGLSDFVVVWPSVSNRIYAVERGTDLMASDFAVISSNIAATPPMNVYTDTVAFPSDKAFYRIRIENRP